MNALIILTLLNIPKVSRKTVNYILKITNIKTLDENSIVNVFKEAKISNTRINIPSIDDIKKAKIKAEDIINECKREGVNILTALDSDFPDKLKEIQDPPVLIYYKGDKRCLIEKKSLAIIGTRTPTNKGIEIAEKLGKLFAKDGFVIVSGLAKGCDELGHKGCVVAKGRSVAVLPCGLDTIYPASNKKLAELILQNKGCLISEYPIGTKPYKNYYVERDRLQSALSEAVIVVETNISGGTMHTVKFALEQKRILACYKHSKEYLMYSQTEGNQYLLRENKATSIYTKKDIANLKDKILYRINSQNNIVEKNKEIEIQISMF